MTGAQLSLLARLANVTMLLGDFKRAAELQDEALRRARRARVHVGGRLCEQRNRDATPARG